MVTKDIKYVGVNDHQVDLFEGHFEVENGMAYNSYVIMDEKIAIFDTVDANFTDEWLNNVAAVLEGRKPDYLIIQHMEPDHSANIMNFMEVYPETTVVASAKAFKMMGQFFGESFEANRLVVGDKDTLSLGSHQLTFFTAPMVHWPEVIVTYDSTDKVLFSADGFGKFGALDVEEDWACEARRYYFGIVGKYGDQVQALLKKLAGAELNAICPLHGPILKENLEYYLGLYQTWSTYDVESEGIVICYTSVYGHTKEAVEMLAAKLEAMGCPKVAVNDLARCDMAEAVEDAFRYGKLVLATTTYNSEIFPYMREFIACLVERGYKNRTIGLIENGSWGPMAAKVMKKLLKPCKNITYTDTTVTILSALNDESTAAIDALAKELCTECQANACACGEAKPMKKYVCQICGYEYEGEYLPEDYICPVCHRSVPDFVEVCEAEPAAPSSKNKYVCQICGYEYECDGELPADFTCPICKRGAEDFKLVE